MAAAFADSAGLDTVLGNDRRRSIPNSVLPTIRRRARRRGRARSWRCRGRRVVSPGAAAHALPVVEERAWPFPELAARRWCRRGCTKGNRNRRRGYGWGGGLFVTTAARPVLSPQARAGRVRGGKPLRRACRSHAATRALVFHASAASGDVRRRGLGTADYAASSFLILLFTGPRCHIRGRHRAPDQPSAGGLARVPGLGSVLADRACRPCLIPECNAPSSDARPARARGATARAVLTSAFQDDVGCRG